MTRDVQRAGLKWACSQSFYMTYARFAIAVLIASLGCAGSESPTGTEEPVPVATRVSLSPEVVLLTEVGSTSQLTATVLDQRGAPMMSAPVSWASSSPTVATVSAGGLVTAVSNGEATIAVTAGTATGTTSVTVDEPLVLTTVTVAPDTVFFDEIGASRQLTATASDQFGADMPGVPFTWESSDQAIATVDAAGMVTGVTNGLVSVIATAEGKVDTTTVIVDEPMVTTIVLAPSPVTLVQVGATERLTATALDQNDVPMDGIVFTWESAAPAIATVSNDGVVTAVRNGDATISAFAEGVVGELVITVDEPLVVTVVEVSPSADTLVLFGDRDTLVAVAFDQFGDTMPDVQFTWSTSDSANAVVDAEGVVTATGDGLVSITATADGVFDSAAIKLELLTSMSASSAHSCGLTSGNDAYCWGWNFRGQLGDGTTANRFTPTLVVGGLEFASLTTGGAATCGLTSVGDAYCWGYNFGGKLGDGTEIDRRAPTAVRTGLTFESLTIGSHTCGLTSAGAAYCWGVNSNGGLGDGTTTKRSTPTAVTGGLAFTSISTSTGHTCGLVAGGAAYCWGANDQGQLGDGTRTGRLEPTLVAGGLSFDEISAGAYYTCGVTATGAAYCWGGNGRGQLGDGTQTSRLTPTLVSGNLSFSTIDTGDHSSLTVSSEGINHTCALTNEGAAYCWGWNSFGEVGDGTQADRLTPSAVIGGRTFTTIAVGSQHSCAMTGSGVAYCWGLRNKGELGDGGTEFPAWRTTPTLVLPSP
jgi:alpha-tubulin suppressor-like RCC1 family protein